MKINEIFMSIDGESKRAGELSTFVRTCGCNLRCPYCDSKYTWIENGTEYTVDQIIDKCKEFNVCNITFTGGEPLLQKDSDELITRLSENGFNVCIETNGSIDFTEKDWFINNLPNVWICADYKVPSSTQSSFMLSYEKFSKLRDNDVIKFVVGTQEDLYTSLEIINFLRNNNCNCYVYFSPIFGSIEPCKIVEFMKNNLIQNKVRFQLQIHKFIWDPNKRGV